MYLRYAYAATEEGQGLIFNFNYNASGRENNSNAETEGTNQSAAEGGFTIDLSDKRFVYHYLEPHRANSQL